MSLSTLIRPLFVSDRALEFCSKKELTAQTGHSPESWPLVILKELVDNALDACEEAGTAPQIGITVKKGAIVVHDNGPGIPAEAIARVLDFDVRVSSREAYVSPTRGAQGNALKTILAMPFAMDGTNGKVEITSRGVRHAITFRADAVRQRPRVSHQQKTSTAFVQNGTHVRIFWPRSACSIWNAARTGFVQTVENYALLNPHATFTLNWEGTKLDYAAKSPQWPKWRAHQPTSIWWYALERLERLVAAYLRLTQGNQKTVREFVAEFDGFTRSSKQKLVLAATGLGATKLGQLVQKGNLHRATLRGLLEAMRKQAKPVAAARLGIIGESHLRAGLESAGCQPDSFRYCRRMGLTKDFLPYVVETAFGFVDDGSAKNRRVVAGVNWSPAIAVNPFRSLDDDEDGAEAILGEQRVNTYDPVILVLHVACPRMEYTDRGKSAVVLEEEVASALVEALRRVTKPWCDQKKKEDRDHRRIQSRREAFRRSRQVTVRHAAFEVMEQAYRKASANGTLPAHARQIMYAARGEILKRTGRSQLDDDYFTQTLLPDYVRLHPEETSGWDIVFDARGSFAEPHTRRHVPLGTLHVRKYLAAMGTHQILNPEVGIVGGFAYPTCGPGNRFGAVLFIEKEGFFPLLERVQLGARYDLALMSTKGISNVASRWLIDRLPRDVPIFVLHDFDRAGFKILGTLRDGTERYGYEEPVNVVDLGLRISDVKAHQLESEPESPKNFSEESLRHYGATNEEIEFLETQRVELNAFPSDRLVTWLEAKLQERGVRKVIPDVDVLQEAYRRAWQAQECLGIAERAMDRVRRQAALVKLPENLREKIAARLHEEPTLSWDQVVAEFVCARGGSP